MIYVFDDDKNKHEGLSKEQIYAVLEQIIEDGDLEHVEPDSAFVSKFKNRVDGGTYGMAFCTQAEYNTMEQAGTLEQNVLYFITDDEEYEALFAALEDLAGRMGDVEAAINGTGVEHLSIDDDWTEVSLGGSTSFQINSNGIYLIEYNWTTAGLGTRTIEFGTINIVGQSSPRIKSTIYTYGNVMHLFELYFDSSSVGDGGSISLEHGELDLSNMSYSSSQVQGGKFRYKKIVEA